MAFAAIAAIGYSVQLILAIALLSNHGNAGLVRALVFLLVALFGSALARAWEVAGIGHRVPHDAPAGRQAEGQEPEVAPTAPEETATVGSTPE
jgi:hypothetical protein